MGLLQIMRENRAKADEQDRAAMAAKDYEALCKRMDAVHELTTSIPLGTELTPAELLHKYTDEALAQARAKEAAPAPGDPLLKASGLLKEDGDD